MEWKKFLKPNWKKIVLFLLLYLVIPYPFLIFYLGESHTPLFSIAGLKEAFQPFSAPSILIHAIDFYLINGLLSNFTEWASPDFVQIALTLILLPFLWLFLVYFVSCWVISLVEKKRKSENIQNLAITRHSGDFYRLSCKKAILFIEK